MFRVSGSQVEMQALRAAFERGDDPLARVRDASDINSVSAAAGAGGRSPLPC